MKGQRRCPRDQADILARGGSVFIYYLFLCFQMCLQNMVLLTVKRDREPKTYKLEELLELQNKLMLLSTKGESSREQVCRFTEVSDV